MRVVAACLFALIAIHEINVEIEIGSLRKQVLALSDGEMSLARDSIQNSNSIIQNSDAIADLAGAAVRIARIIKVRIKDGRCVR